LPASPQFMCGSGLPFSQADRKNLFCVLAKDIMQYTKQFVRIKCLININVIEAFIKNGKPRETGDIGYKTQKRNKIINTNNTQKIKKMTNTVLM
jgi:hypothetical protein